MANWFWEQAGTLPQPDDELWLELGNIELAPAARAFSANVLQIRQFWELAPYVLKIFEEHLSTFQDVTFRLTGQLKLSREDHERYRDQIMAGTKEILDRKLAALHNVSREGNRRWLAIDTFSRIVNDVPELARAVRATLSSQIVLSWSAFEVLCGDLARAVDKDSEAKGFSSTRLILQNYKTIFPDGNEIEQIIGDEAVRKLSILRNLFAHDSGIVTQKTLGYASQIGWTFPGEIDKEFHVDGEVVRTFVAPVITLGEELIYAVDRWLNSRKP